VIAIVNVKKSEKSENGVDPSDTAGNPDIYSKTSSSGHFLIMNTLKFDGAIFAGNALL
jgi:hypothetical protein